jgi:hypothetical protein
MPFLPKPEILTRSDWDCPDTNSAPQYTTVTHLIIHHTAISRDDADWPKFMRDIWICTSQPEVGTT